MPAVRSRRFDRGGDLDVQDVAGCDGHGVAQHFARFADPHVVVQRVDDEKGACFHVNLGAVPDVVLDAARDEKPEQFLHALGFADCRAELVHVAL